MVSFKTLVIHGVTYFLILLLDIILDSLSEFRTLLFLDKKLILVITIIHLFGIAADN